MFICTIFSCSHAGSCTCVLYYWFTCRDVCTPFLIQMQSYVYYFSVHMQSRVYYLSGIHAESCVIDSHAESCAWFIFLVHMQSRVVYFSGSHAESCVLFVWFTCRVVCTIFLVHMQSRVYYLSGSLAESCVLQYISGLLVHVQSRVQYCFWFTCRVM